VELADDVAERRDVDLVRLGEGQHHPGGDPHLVHQRLRIHR